MFQLRNRTTGACETIYGIHKSGPMDEQTKLLVFSATGWRWAWAQEFQPMVEKPVSWEESPPRIWKLAPHRAA